MAKSWGKATLHGIALPTHVPPESFPKLGET